MIDDLFDVVAANDANAYYLYDDYSLYTTINIESDLVVAHKSMHRTAARWVVQVESEERPG